MNRTATSVDDFLDDVWDTRSLIELVDSLEEERTIYCAHEGCLSNLVPVSGGWWGHEDDEEFDHVAVAPDYADVDAWEEADTELDRARNLAAEVEPLSEDYLYGSTVVRDSYFEEYAEELAKDCGYLSDHDDNNPLLSCIDWGKWAEMVQQDYSSFEFEGTTWWVR